MWRSAGRILSGSRLGRRKTTFESTPHIASGSRTRLHAFAHDPPYFKLIRLTSPKYPYRCEGG